MKKASDIVLLVSAILGFVTAGIMFLCAIMFTIFSMPFFTDFIKEGIENGSIHTTAENTDAAIIIARVTFISCAVCFFIIVILMIIASAICLKARKQHTKGLFITAIVFGAISGLESAIVGGIFGLIGTRNERQEQEVIDMTKE